MNPGAFHQPATTRSIATAGLGPMFTKYASSTLVEAFQSVVGSDGVYRTIQPDSAGLMRFWLTHAYSYTESGGIPALDTKLFDVFQDGSNIEVAISAKEEGSGVARTWFPAHGGATSTTAIQGSLSVKRDGETISSGESAFVATTDLVVEATYDVFNDNDLLTKLGDLYLRLIFDRAGAKHYVRFTPSVGIDCNTGYLAMFPAYATRIASRRNQFSADREDGSDINFNGEDGSLEFYAFDPDTVAQAGWVTAMFIEKPQLTKRVGKSGRRSPIFFADDGVKVKAYCASISNVVVPTSEVLEGSARYVTNKSPQLISRLPKWTPSSAAYKLGLWIKPSTTTAYSDSGTTLATIGGAVQQVNDSSGLGRHITQTTAENQPTLQSGKFPLRVNLSTAGTTEDYMTAPQATPNCLVIWGCVSRSSYSGTTDIYFYDTGNNLAIFNNSANDAINFRDGSATIRSVAGLGDQFAFVWRTGTNGRILTSDGGEITAAMHATDWDTLRVGETVAGGTVLGVAEFGLATDLTDSEMDDLLAYLQRHYL